MTGEEMVVRPTVEEVRNGRVSQPETIYVQSNLARGDEPRTGILISSDWMVDYERKQVRFTAGNLVVYSEKIPISVVQVPDRHKRAVRRVAGAIFKVKRFTGLVLYHEPQDDTLFVVPWKSDNITSLNPPDDALLISRSDAILWCLLNPESGARESDISCTTVDRVRRELLPGETRHGVIRIAQKNSAALSAELMRLLLQAHSGVGSLNRLSTLMHRGLRTAIMENVWKQYKKQDFPKSLRRALKLEE
jgi:hypothetical protein